MIYDPVINEIRKVRRDIEAEYHNDPDKYFLHLIEIQKQYKNLVRRNPKPRLQTQKNVQKSIPSDAY